MTKIIIDKYLKNSTLIDKNIEINLSKEYEVLSKNTSLYAEIINDKSQEKQLIKSNIFLSKKEKILIKKNFLKKLAPKGVYRYRRAKKYEKELNDEDSETDTINNDDDLTELIISQDPIKGFWNKNDNKIKIEVLLEKNIINNINNICLEYK